MHLMPWASGMMIGFITFEFCIKKLRYVLQSLKCRTPGAFPHTRHGAVKSFTLKGVDTKTASYRAGGIYTAFEVLRYKVTDNICNGKVKGRENVCHLVFFTSHPLILPIKW
jgi:hypothetical protein